MTEAEWTQLIQGLTKGGNLTGSQIEQNLGDYNTATGLDPKQRYGANNAARFLLPGEFAYQAHQLGFANELQPEAHDAIRNLISMLQNPDAMSAEYRNKVMGDVQAHFPELYNHFQSLGAGIGAQQGSYLAANNQAANSANKFDAGLRSPTGLMDRGNAIASLVNSQRPDYGGISQLGATQVSTPRNVTGGQIAGGLIGQGLGAFAGGGFGGFGGGGGGGIAYPGGDPNRSPGSSPFGGF